MAHSQHVSCNGAAPCGTAAGEPPQSNCSTDSPSSPTSTTFTLLPNRPNTPRQYAVCANSRVLRGLDKEWGCHASTTITLSNRCAVAFSRTSAAISPLNKKLSINSRPWASPAVMGSGDTGGTLSPPPNRYGGPATLLAVGWLSSGACGDASGVAVGCGSTSACRSTAVALGTSFSASRASPAAAGQSIVGQHGRDASRCNDSGCCWAQGNDQCLFACGVRCCEGSEASSSCVRSMHAPPQSPAYYLAAAGRTCAWACPTQESASGPGWSGRTRCSRALQRQRASLRQRRRV